MLRLYVYFLSEAGLLGKTTVAVDGSKFRAVNSKKNNLSQKKIDKHQQFTKDKAEKYLQELDELGKLKQATNKGELQLKKEKITWGLRKLKERTIKYGNLQYRLNNTTDKQFSTTDEDSRSKLTTKSIIPGGGELDHFRLW